MQHLRKKIVSGVLLALLGLFSPVASGQIPPGTSGISPKMLDGQLAVGLWTSPQLVLADATEVVVDIDGVILGDSVWSGAAAQSPAITEANSQDVGTMPYPAKLRVVLIDGGAASGALTCTSITLNGYDQFHIRQSETISTITETSQTGRIVFEQVTSYSSVGCAIASGGDTSDILRVSTSLDIGLPRKIKTYSDIISVCVVDESDATDEVQCMRGAGTITGARVSLQEAGAVDLVCSSVNLVDSDLNIVAANLDKVSMRIRTSDRRGL